MNKIQVPEMVSYDRHSGPWKNISEMKFAISGWQMHFWISGWRLDTSVIRKMFRPFIINESR